MCLEKRLAHGESLLNKTFKSEVKSLFPGNVKRNRNKMQSQTSHVGVVSEQVT